MAKSFFIYLVDTQGDPLPDSENAEIVFKNADDDTTEFSAQNKGDGKFHLKEFNFDEETIIHISRKNAVRITTILNLNKFGDSRFVRGRPTIMTLKNEGTTRDKRTSLHVKLASPQEVIICTGAEANKKKDKRLHLFVNLAFRRIERMTSEGITQNLGKGIVRVDNSCTFTLFEFNGKKSKVHHLIAGIGTKDLPGDDRKGHAVLMETVDFPVNVLNPEANRDFLGANDVYVYLGRTGRERPGTIRAIEFMSHGYWGGPVMENSFRTPDSSNLTETDPKKRIEEKNRIINACCYDGCPGDENHETTFFAMPRHFRYLEYLGVVGDEGSQLRAKEFARVIRREETDDDKTVPHKSRVNFKVKNKFDEIQDEDSDFRNTDFLMFGSENLKNMKKAVHPDCIARIWGCSFGDMGPRLRKLSGLIDGPAQERLNIDSQYSASVVGRADKVVIQQLWKIRRKDAQLIFLSQSRRSYSQMIANHLGCTAYGAIPGTWSAFRTTPNLGGMKVFDEQTNTIKKLANSITPDVFDKKDEANYGRFVPNPPKAKVKLSVLITGFAPFNKDAVNASTEAVKLVSKSKILNQMKIPSYIDLDFKFEEPLTDVDVVWTCPTHVPEKGPNSSGRIRGGKGILEKALNLNGNEGPDIVLLVGEAAGLAQGLKLIRLEPYARNKGSDKTKDNDDNIMSNPNALFKNNIEYLETSVPRTSWVNAVFKLHSDKIPVNYPDLELVTNSSNEAVSVKKDTAGNFICNETYYQLLHEARVGSAGKKPSGRWVLLAHVGATRLEKDFKTIARGLEITVASLMEDMLWASEVFGREAPLSDKSTALVTP